MNTKVGEHRRASPGVVSRELSPAATPSRGLTLIELLVAMTILLLITAVTLPIIAPNLATVGGSARRPARSTSIWGVGAEPSPSSSAGRWGCCSCPCRSPMRPLRSCFPPRPRSSRSRSRRPTAASKSPPRRPCNTTRQVRRHLAIQRLPRGPRRWATPRFSIRPWSTSTTGCG